MLRLLLQVLQMLGPQSRALLTKLVLVSVGSAILQVVGVSSVVPFVALVANPDTIRSGGILAQAYDYFAFASFEAFIAASGAVMVVSILISNSFNALATWVSLKFAATARIEMSCQLLLNYCQKPYSFFLSNNTASLLRDVLQEINNMQAQCLTPAASGLVSLVTIVTVSLALLCVNPVATLFAILLFGGAYLSIYSWCSKAQGRHGKTRMEAEAMRFKLASELLHGQRDIRLLNCHQHFLAGFQVHTSSSAEASLRSSLLAQLPRQGLEIGAFASVPVLTVYFLASGIETHSFLPLLGIYAVAGVRLLPQIQILFQSVSNLRFSSAIVERLQPELSYISTPTTPQLKPLDWNDEIRIADVTYSFPNSQKPVLRGLELSIQKNSAIAIVGTTGAGKTTIINFLTGLLQADPGNGSLMIDGKALEFAAIDSWQANIGFVPQDIYLFDSSIAENIAFGIPKVEIDISQVASVTAMAQLDEFVESLPEGLNTIIGERGIRLSGGQRQRIGIARALYRRPTVLVLDEATSALDAITEHSVMQAISDLRKKLTVIIVAHRISTVKSCDRIYVLDSGLIVDSGSYSELMNRSLAFQRLAQI